MAIDTLSERYEQERQKRQNDSKGLAAFYGRHDGPEFTLDDPWIESGTAIVEPVKDGGHVKIVVYGAGFGGLLAAIKCLETGAAASPDDLLIIDPAGGFGGTWYWNRYPGIMCDIESSVYLPLLENTGFIPTRRYPGGEEIRRYTESLAKFYKIDHRAMFQSAGTSVSWVSDHWECEISQRPKGSPQREITIHADFVILGTGGFTYPKVANVPGAANFKGPQLHTGRWSYSITGGSPDNPVLDKLSDKKVAIIGTGATAIQAVPELAKYAGALYVVQRTPSAVDEHKNRPIDPEEWRTKIANKKGWQSERADALQISTEQDFDLPDIEFEGGFSAMPSVAGAFGGPSNLPLAEAEKRIQQIRAIDDVRSERVRARALEIVKDQNVAQKLQAWYPGYCKRPTFHDEFLPAFNRPNVTLIDTDGASVEAITETGFVVNGKEYAVDLIIWGTGYGNPFTESLAGKAEMKVKGKNGVEMEELNSGMDLSTLHGCLAGGFPNLFFLGLNQAGVGVNQVQRLERQSEHIAYIIAESEKRLEGNKKVIIEPTRDGCEKWADEIEGAAHLISGALGCTPGYFTLEGDMPRLPPEALKKMARVNIYGQGYLKYARILDAWEADGSMSGVAVAAAG